MRAPRSLGGQMAMLVALALFVAQAVNFAMLLAERRAVRLQQAAGPAVGRLSDAADRVARGLPPERGRVRLLASDPIAAGLPREPDVERAVAAGLADAGVRATRVVTGVRPFRADDPGFPRRRGRRSGHPRPDAEVLVAVELPGRGWLATRAPWPGGEGALMGGLALQTLILYAAVLAPVLWIARRIARPLRDLRAAAEGFAPGDARALPETGPPDVAALVAAFNNLRRRVTAMLDEKDRMLGAIGHDLRTPLAALRVRIESVEDDADRQRMADTVMEMDRTLDDILSLARVGRPSEPATEVDVAALVDAVVEDFRDLGAAVTLEEGERLPMRLRPSLTRRAVRNLIENAVKYAGAAEVRVEPGLREVRIVVADRGPGVPPDRLADVFDPFTRLEQSRNRETGGIGLGLALARAVVRDAGGEVTLANRAGGGLEAVIALPRRV